MKWPDVFKLWTGTYIGNIAGTVIFDFLIYKTGVFNGSSVNDYLLTAAENKVNAPIVQLFFRGIFCNWLVCLAFFVQMSLKGDGPKLFCMVLFVFCFFISGYELSIANMCLFAISLVLDHPNAISFGVVVHHLIPVDLETLSAGTS